MHPNTISIIRDVNLFKEKNPVLLPRYNEKNTMAIIFITIKITSPYIKKSPFIVECLNNIRQRYKFLTEFSICASHPICRKRHDIFLNIPSKGRIFKNNTGIYIISKFLKEIISNLV